jgi:glycogen debranching enzyme
VHRDRDVTLVEGQTFCISDGSGDIDPGLPHGLFLLDTRVLSRFELRLNGHRLEQVAVATTDPFAATFATRSAPAAGAADADLVVFRRRHIGRGMREVVSVHSFGLSPIPVVLELTVDVDFADLFEVKESRVRPRPGRQQRIDADGLVFELGAGDQAKRAALRFSSPAMVEPGSARWSETLAPGETWELCLEVTLEVGDRPIEPRFGCGWTDEDATPRQQLASWRARLPNVTSDHPDLAAAMGRAGEDLGALRIFDPDHPELPILAAGAPWFMTVFGRDSLLTSWMTLLADPSLAHGVLETLARFQGEDVDDGTEEEPGKILHEMRFASSSGLALGGGDIYYGSIDATPLFVMLLGELRRWGLADDLVARLLPHAHRALDWMEEFGDRDGDGYLEYERRNPNGLANQGWKDSWDSVRCADGRLPAAPIALCEVQGYAFAAYLAGAYFALEAGDHARYERYRARAVDLRRRFNEDFWLDEHGTYALGLDGDKRPIDAVTSNVGHCLWTGIVDRDRAARVADRLMQPDLFCGWGVRTLATSMAAYNPVSYHNGSVWPHDNAICAAGLNRYGFTEAAHRIIDGQLAAARAHGDRLPELFAGFDREVLPVPGAYPASCSPQAWAAASPLLWLRTLLRLDPWMPHGTVWIAPELPPSIGTLEVRGIRLGDATLDIAVDDGRIDITCGPSVAVVRQPRPPLTSLLDG